MTCGKPTLEALFMPNLILEDLICVVHKQLQRGHPGLPEEPQWPLLADLGMAVRYKIRVAELFPALSMVVQPLLPFRRTRSP